MPVNKQSNKVIARRKQELRFVEGKLWSLQLLRAMLGTVSDPVLIRYEIDRLERMIEEDKQTLKKQIEGGEQHDERTTNVQQPINVRDADDVEKRREQLNERYLANLLGQKPPKVD